MKNLIDTYTSNQTVKETKEKPWHRGELLTKNEQRKHQCKMGNKPKVSNKEIKAPLVTSLSSFHCKPKAHNTDRCISTTINSE